MASVWGIDIGKAALKAVKLRRTGEGLEIQAIEYLPYPVEEDEDERQEHVNDAIRNFLNKHKLGSDQVIVGIPGLHAFSRFIKLPPVEKSKVGMMVRMEAQQQIPFPIAEVNWDFTILDRDYEPGEEIEVGIFATRSELIDGFLGDMKENGLFPDIVTIAPLAVYNFLRYNSESEEGGTIILDIGAEHTDLVIMDEERFWIRNLRIAGNDITKALADRFKIPFAEAEKLKKSSSKSQQAKKIFNSMESVLKDLIGEIHRSVGFFKSQADDLSVKRMILMGDGAKLKSLAKYLKQQLKYDVRRVTQLEEERFVLGEEVDVNVISKHILGFGVAIGLAIQGLREARCSINLAPQQLQIQSKLKKKIPFAILTAVATWACLGLSHVYWKNQRESVKTALKSLRTVSSIQDVQEKAKAAKADLPNLEKVSQPYKNLGDGRTLLLEFVNKLQTVLPTKNEKLPKIDQSLKLDDKMTKFNEARRTSKFNLKKTWLLACTTSRKKPSKPGEQVPYKVELKVAKALDEAAGQGASDVRAKIKAEVADKLTEQLAGAPFWIRKPGTTTYGKMEISPSKDIYAVHPDREEEFGRNPFHCIMVTLTFEIGVAPAPKKPAPKPADGQQPNQGGTSMADIDAKEILTRNVPLVIIYAIAIAPLAVWFLVMSDIKDGKKDSFKSEFNKLRRQSSMINQLDTQIKAKDENNPVYTESDVEEFGKRKGLLEAQNQGLVKLVAERDKALKVWFPKWKDTAWAGTAPEYSEYAEHWKETAIPKLLEEFKELVTPSEEGAEPRLFGTAPPGRNKVRDGQKKFWIQKAILTALKDGGKTRTPKLNAVPLFTGGGDQSKPDDGSLYQTLDCEVDVTASLRDLPLILRAILAQPLPMQIVGLAINKAAFRYERPWKQGPNEPALVDGAEMFFQDFAYTAQLEKLGDFKENLETYIPEPPVRIVIKVEVFDFQVGKKPEKKK